MKKSIILLLGLSLSTAMAKEMPKHKGSAELEKIKTLVGTWTGEIDHGNGPEAFSVNYKVTGGGSAVVETHFSGTLKEMTTVYHDEKGKLTLTHYCMLGNQPRMKMTDSSDNRISLKLAKKKSIGKDEMHMHSLTIDFIDDHKIKQTWALYAGEKEVSSKPMELTRKRAGKK